VFLERGLAHATMADVSEAAGVAKGTVYRYFDSKSALLTALRARYTSQWLARSGRLDAPRPRRPGRP
jgi:AcrR family transcriptional regulator